MKDSFAPIPFWFLNHRLEESELLRQLKLMKESGVAGFFIHPRAGLLTPYASSAWFERVRFIVQEAAKLGLDAWLYDEDPYPSGAAGGRLTMENPEFIARSICCQIVEPNENGMFRADLGETARLLKAFTYVPAADGSVTDPIDVSESVGILREMYHKSKWPSSYYCDWIKEVKYPHERAESFIPKLIFEHPAESGRKAVVLYTKLTAFDDKYDWVPDCLNRACVKRFIELTHEKYKKWMGEFFGNAIPGIFTDESFVGGYPPWTGELEAAFARLHGYSLMDRLHLLWFAGEEAQRFKRDYWRTIRHLYRENFFGQITDWCKQNNLMLVGHLAAEEDPFAHASCGGGAYALMAHLDVPGFDILGQTLGNRERPALLFGAHSVCSAARQQGKKRVLCENMACNPFSFGPRDMLRTTNWLYSQGINWLSPHGFHYSYDGFRKHDAGKSFFFQDEYFAEFPRYAAYADKMGRRLSEGEAIGTTALLLPSALIAGYKPVETEAALAVRTSVFRAVAELVGRHIEYEVIDDEKLEEAVAADGGVTVGCRRYTQVLIPCETADAPLVERLTAAGVQVLFGVDGAFDWSAVAKCAVCTPITGEGAVDILVNRTAHEGGDEMFLFNNAATVANIDFDGTWALWDTEADAWYRVSLPLAMSGYGACYLKAVSAAEAAALPLAPETEAVPYAPPVQEWTYRPAGALAVLSEWAVEAQTADGRAIQTTHEFCRIRDVVGTELTYMKERLVRPIFDAAPLTPSPYPAAVRYTTTFCLPEGTTGRRRLVIEGSTLQGDCRLTVNGHAITESDFTQTFVYDVTNRVADITPWLQEGDNEVCVAFAAGGEFDGLESALYIM
ncbi:MAG: hypothetical protein IJC17_04660 [Clostridia bacterium]|nr:hypothetical protein [Clostridia bacterium]